MYYNPKKNGKAHAKNLKMAASRTQRHKRENSVANRTMQVCTENLLSLIGLFTKSITVSLLK